MLKSWKMALLYLTVGMTAAGTAYAQAQRVSTYGPDLVERAGLTREMSTQSSSTVQSGINRLSGGSVTSGRLASFTAGNEGFSASTARQRLGVWSTGTLSILGNNSTALNTRGHYGTVAAGMDYLVVDGVVVGMSGMYEMGDFRTRYNRGNFDVTGFTLAPYAAVNVMRYVTLSAQAGFTWLDKEYDRANNTITANYDARRMYGLGRLALNYPTGNWRFGADLSYLHVTEDNDAFTEAGTGRRVAGTDINVNQIGFGTKIGYAFRPEHLGTLTPYVMARLEHDFAADAVVAPRFDGLGNPTGAVTNIDGDSTSLTVGGGLDFDFGNFLGGIEGNTLVGKDNITNHTFLGNVKFRF